MSLFLAHLQKLRGIIPLTPKLSTSTVPSPVLIDIREHPETTKGPNVPQSLLIPRSHLEMKVEHYVPKVDTPIVLMCSGGVRSVLAAQSLREMGYTNVSSLEGGITAWANTQK
jgi:rhodanese-related sulfurtransferase